MISVQSVVKLTPPPAKLLTGDNEQPISSFQYIHSADKGSEKVKENNGRRHYVTKLHGNSVSDEQYTVYGRLWENPRVRATVSTDLFALFQVYITIVLGSDCVTSYNFSNSLQLNGTLGIFAGYRGVGPCDLRKVFYFLLFLSAVPS